MSVKHLFPQCLVLFPLLISGWNRQWTQTQLVPAKPRWSKPRYITTSRKQTTGSSASISICVPTTDQRRHGCSWGGYFPMTICCPLPRSVVKEQVNLLCGPSVCCCRPLSDTVGRDGRLQSDLPVPCCGGRHRPNSLLLLLHYRGQ